MKRSLLLAFVVAAPAFLIQPAPAHADLKLCNLTPSRVGVALGYKAVDFAKAGLPQLHLLIISVIVAALEIWMVVETVKVLLGGKKAESSEQGVVRRE